MNWVRRARQVFWSTVFAAFWRRAMARGAEEAPHAFSVLVRGGTVYDGRGGPPFVADIGIVRDRIVAIGDLAGQRARQQVDAQGLAVAPGFINMLSWATESLLVDPASESDLRQGVTLEVFGEGVSMGPLNAAMKHDLQLRQGELSYPVDWTTLGEYLEFLEERGVATNVASFVGATSLRIHELGYANRAPGGHASWRACASSRARPCARAPSASAPR